MEKEDLIDLIMYALSNEGFMSASDIIDTWLEKKSVKSSTSNEALTLPTIEHEEKVCPCEKARCNFKLIKLGLNNICTKK